MSEAPVDVGASRIQERRHIRQRHQNTGKSGLVKHLELVPNEVINAIR